MLGSHNSLTYLPCRKWWMYLINWAAICQSKNLSEQYHAGVRYFDLRIKFNKDKKPIIAHGLVEYKGNIEHYLTTLNELSKHFYKEPIYVRFVLEFNKKPNDWVEQAYLLESLVRDFRGEYPYLTYDYCMFKWNEAELIRFNNDKIELYHRYSSTLSWKRFLWIPYWYAKLHNKEFRQTYLDVLEDETNKALMLDFV